MTQGRLLYKAKCRKILSKEFESKERCLGGFGEKKGKRPGFIDTIISKSKRNNFKKAQVYHTVNVRGMYFGVDYVLSLQKTV